MWIAADFEATALFSLKPATSTSSGGKTLLIPTPFAVKMALLDVICRTEGVAEGEHLWLTLAGANVAIRPPARIVVNNTFAKVWKLRRTDTSKKEKKDEEPITESIEDPSEGDEQETVGGGRNAGPLGASIAYREYAYLDGLFGIALDLPFSAALSEERAARWLIGIQSLGKRGSFVQAQHYPTFQDTLPDGYIVLNGDFGEMLPLNRIIQQVDDTSTETTFQRVNIYAENKGKGKLELGTHRLLRPVLLPYKVRRASRSFTFYERVAD